MSSEDHSISICKHDNKMCCIIREDNLQKLTIVLVTCCNLLIHYKVQNDEKIFLKSATKPGSPLENHLQPQLIRFFSSNLRFREVRAVCRISIIRFSGSRFMPCSLYGHNE
jgi:hypothetical protein